MGDCPGGNVHGEMSRVNVDWEMSYTHGYLRAPNVIMSQKLGSWPTSAVFVPGRTLELPLDLTSSSPWKQRSH